MAISTVQADEHAVEELRRRSHINEVAQATGYAKNFSELIKAHLAQ